MVDTLERYEGIDSDNALDLIRQMRLLYQEGHKLAAAAIQLVEDYGAAFPSDVLHRLPRDPGLAFWGAPTPHHFLFYEPLAGPDLNLLKRIKPVLDNLRSRMSRTVADMWALTREAEQMAAAISAQANLNADNQDLVASVALEILAKAGAIRAQLPDDEAVRSRRLETLVREQVVAELEERDGLLHYQNPPV